MKSRSYNACRQAAGKASRTRTSRVSQRCTASCSMKSGWQAKSKPNSASSASEAAPRVLPTDLTVSAVVQRDGRYLIVEERASGVIVFTQPGGHIEAGESPEQAVVRETLEETRCTVEVESLLNVYLWIQPQTRQQFLRIVYVARFAGENPALALDDGI